MNYKSHAGRFRRLSKWGGFGSEPEEKPALYKPQEFSPPTAKNSHSIQDEPPCPHPTLSHKTSSSYDELPHPNDSAAWSKSARVASKTTRPHTEFSVDHKLSLKSKASGRYHIALPNSGSPPLSLAPHIPSIFKNGSPKVAPLNVSKLSTDTLLNSVDDLLLQSLISQSMSEAQSFDIISLQELDRIKRESEALKLRISTLSTRLELEGKVKEAAQSLARLHAANKKMANQAQEQLVVAHQKIDEIARELWQAHQRRHDIQSTVQRHNAAVLCVAYQRKERELTRIQESLRLREGQDAVVDSSFFSGVEEPTQFNSTPPSPEPSSAVLQIRLDDALTTIRSQKLQIEELSQSSESAFEAQLQASQQRIRALESSVTNHITSRSQSSIESYPSPPGSQILVTKIESTQSELQKLRHEHSQVMLELEDLYRELPGPNSDEEIQPFSVSALMERIDQLVGENHDLIDRVLDLQTYHKEVEISRNKIIHLNSQIEELQNTLAATQAQIGTLEEKNTNATSHVDTLKEEHALTQAQLESLRAEHLLAQAQFESLKEKHSQVQTQLESLGEEHTKLLENEKLSKARSRKSSIGGSLHLARGSTLQAELAAILDGLGQAALKAQKIKNDRDLLIASQFKNDLTLGQNLPSSETTLGSKVHQDIHDRVPNVLTPCQQESAMLAI